MDRDNKFSCFIIGSESHLIQCAEILLKRGHQICGIISSREMIRSWAYGKGLLHIEPGPELVSVLHQQPFDYLFSITHLSIISDDILTLPRKGAINFHDGPLPQYGGLYVTSWALINEELSHGVTWHLMSSQVDTGDVLKQRIIEITKGDTAFTLNAKCYEAGISLFAELVDELESGQVKCRKQDVTKKTYYSKFKRPPAACTISWRQQAGKISAMVRALDFGSYPNPLGLPKVFIGNEVFIVPGIHVLDIKSQVAAGTITAIGENSLRVATLSNEVELRRLLAINGHPLSIADIVARFELHEGDIMPELDLETAAQLTALNSGICRNEAFWIKKLANVKPVELPFVNPSKLQNGSGRYETILMPVPDEIDTFIAEHDDMANKGNFLTIAIAAYLSRFSNNLTFDLGFSYPALRQKVAGFECFFATQVPLRVELDPSMTVDAALNMLYAEVELVKERQTYARDAIHRYPDLDYLKVDDDCLPWSTAVEVVEFIEADIPLSGCELTILVSEDGKECCWVYDKAVLDHESVVSMQHHFVTFLQNIMVGHNSLFTEIPLLTETEYQQLMIKWNSTRVDYPPHRYLHQLFESQAEQTPDAVAVICEDQQITYSKLNSRANQIAHHLRKLNIGTETCIGIYMERSIDMMVGLLGVLKAGGAYIPLDVAYPLERIAFMLEDSQVPVILTQSHLHRNLPVHQAHVIYIDTDWDDISTGNNKNINSGVTPGNLCYVIYTSGSTGKPKGVMVSHDNVVNFLTGMDQRIGCKPSDIWLAVTSISFDISVLELFWPLTCGAKVVLYSGIGEDLSAHAAQLIRGHHVTHMQCTPSLARILISNPESFESLRLLKKLLLGGESLSPSLVEQLGAVVSGEIHNMYGPTETTIWSTTHTLDKAGGFDDAISIGRPIANTELYVLDRNMQPVPIGVPGELFIGGKGVARGYLNRQELTKERFIPNPFKNRSDDRLYRTGDLVRYLPDGNLEFLGRLDHQIKIRGNRVEPGEIESILAAYPEVRDVLVMPRSDLLGEIRLIAYVVTQQAKKIRVEVLRRFLLDKLPEFMVPSAFVFLEALPLMPNGKVNRGNLPIPELVRPEQEKGYEAPRSSTEKMLARLWTEVLGIENIGIHDNFFELGGHSLSVVQVVIRMRQAFNIEISLQTVFHEPTIAGLAVKLKEKHVERKSIIETVSK